MTSAFSTVQSPVPRRRWRTVALMSFSWAWKHRIRLLFELEQWFSNSSSIGQLHPLHLWSFVKSPDPLKFLFAWAAVQEDMYLESPVCNFLHHLHEAPNNFLDLSLHKLWLLPRMQKQLAEGSEEAWGLGLYLPGSHECSKLQKVWNGEGTRLQSGIIST